MIIQNKTFGSVPGPLPERDAGETEEILRKNGEAAKRLTILENFDNIN